MDVTSDVIAIVASKIRGPRRDIQVSDRLADLGLESIDAVEAIFDLEEKFDIQITLSPNDVRSKLNTVDDVLRLVQGLIDDKA